uniref:Uncharacterized protein n=1 Tax=Siphoviridae sp. ctWDo30 TaxID=2826360 RepID=A0A8S5N541_9CAUD|nr:MAG TPA: hypothetical protein [Siphoviridae sp. ctWDo30]
MSLFVDKSPKCVTIFRLKRFIIYKGKTYYKMEKQTYVLKYLKQTYVCAIIFPRN